MVVCQCCCCCCCCPGSRVIMPQWNCNEYLQSRAWRQCSHWKLGFGIDTAIMERGMERVPLWMLFSKVTVLGWLNLCFCVNEREQFFYISPWKCCCVNSYLEKLHSRGKIVSSSSPDCVKWCWCVIHSSTLSFHQGQSAETAETIYKPLRRADLYSRNKHVNSLVKEMILIWIDHFFTRSHWAGGGSYNSSLAMKISSCIITQLPLNQRVCTCGCVLLFLFLLSPFKD